MKLDLVRFTPKDRPDDTLGLFFINGEIRAFALEDAYHPEKIKGRTRIPAGTYDVILTPSPKFGREMPLIDKVPGYEGIRMHSGTSAADTDGCLLLGLTATIMRTKPSALANSRIAVDEIEPEIVGALRAKERVTIEVHEVLVLQHILPITPITVS